ncbi:mitochondrial large subunit ribosomal protein-domain-containing protein [Lipomyces tetrasporus]|uniref:Large ribosomal subunit protein mL49 n=1 Tax=Lipomyces tetrasporus TaxID=54092 RepID=A0AAD7QUL8_9ASCO|nr:mitochondrial large subunit ribosomal protein-domain-containing protein [Lipomyces tetrasporus]KAJ8101734.1 mitochondrial large subunit ribosomal protein-domain-containing protein [Lipomyces tetrasporus]
MLLLRISKLPVNAYRVTTNICVSRSILPPITNNFSTSSAAMGSNSDSIPSVNDVVVPYASIPKRDLKTPKDRRKVKNIPREPEMPSQPNDGATPLKFEYAPGGPETSHGFYFVDRTSAGNLPVYKEFKNGGSLVVTIVKGIRGDALALKRDIQAALGLTSDRIAVNPVTHHIAIKGDYFVRTRDLLNTVF